MPVLVVVAIPPLSLKGHSCGQMLKQCILISKILLLGIVLHDCAHRYCKQIYEDGTRAGGLEEVYEHDTSNF